MYDYWLSYMIIIWKVYINKNINNYFLNTFIFDGEMHIFIIINTYHNSILLAIPGTKCFTLIKNK